MANGDGADNRHHLKDRGKGQGRNGGGRNPNNNRNARPGNIDGGGKGRVDRGKELTKEASSNHKGEERSYAPTPSTSGMPKAVWKEWRRKGACLVCGSESHKMRDCKVRSAIPAKARNTQNAGTTRGQNAGSQKGKSSSGQRTKGTTATATQDPSKFNVPSSKYPQNAGNKRSKGSNVEEGSRKRQRDQEPSGQTPPAKKSTTKKFSYAQAAASSLELAIVTKDHVHCSWKDYMKLRNGAEERFMEMLDKGVVPLQVEKWEYNTHWATVHASDGTAEKELRQVASKYNLVLVPKAELEAVRKPTKMFMGLITGPAAKHSKETLERLLKFECERNKIPGRLSYVSSTPVARSGNVLLRVCVDADAEERLKEIGGTLRIGASGNVKLEDTRAKYTVDASTRLEKINKLEEEIEAAKASLTQKVKIKRELEQQMDLDEALPSGSTTPLNSDKAQKPTSEGTSSRPVELVGYDTANESEEKE